MTASRVSDASVSALTAGFVAVLVGFTSSVALVFQAAQALGATPAQSASWMWALGWGMGLATLLPSIGLRKPVMIAWSTPGAAVLAVAGASGGFAMAEATGAFIVCAVLIVLAGASGAFALNFAAITAAICMGREAHADPDRRWVAAAACGAIYCVVGVFGAAVAGLLAAFPRELVVAVAGLALLGTIGSGLAAALKDDAYREAALITFLVTLSGVELLGVGSACAIGVVAGAAALFVQQWRPRRGQPRS